MSISFEGDGLVRLYVGDCLTVLRTMPEKFYHTCVTSPPYYRLRDYRHSDQIGLEKTPDEYIGKLLDVFSALGRVLRDDGTLWLNIGDSYSGRKSKNLLMMPSRIALALQADGWYIRSHIIWHKPNVMPENVKDRPTGAHESIFLLTKSASYYYDADAVAEAAICDRMRGRALHPDTISTNGNSGLSRRPVTGKRNLRNVWSVNTRSFKEAHFATFPPDLIEPCIKAGCPEGCYVIDPFGGSGTTGLVARNLRRRADLIEINPAYADIAKRTSGAVIITEFADTAVDTGWQRPEEFYPTRVRP